MLDRFVDIGQTLSLRAFESIRRTTPAPFVVARRTTL
jgi:hypothetical protein